jgi:regulator of protease activity HflC (stomatin/prohibitin superfamily)
MTNKSSNETAKKAISGWPFLVLAIILLPASVFLLILGIRDGSAPLIVTGIKLLILFLLDSGGFYMLAPNQAAVLSLFGEYKGTVKEDGLHWVNPFYSRKKLSLRSRNLNGEKLKVNDHIGNPIEIAAVIVWKVRDTYKASFEVENYDSFVKIQSESAVRHLANMYPYDFSDTDSKITLRGNIEEVAETLKKELQERVGNAGVLIEEARISHLAYAPEIAAAMLQRQQASAVIAARQKIVEGAVGMVEMAIDKLGEKGVVDLDEEKKAAMVSNLMVVLCAEKAAAPIVNAGTLYH